MPCREASNWDETTRTVIVPDPNDKREINRLEAMLCAVLRVYPRQYKGTISGLINNIDEKESGISKKELQKWWDEHQAKDEKRTKLKREKEEKERLKRRALSKLSLEEKKILGVN